jgi:hypothetical protein
MNARRTAEDQTLHMERAYVDAESGKTICCWQAGSREQIVDLFKRAGVVFESIAAVTEVLETDLNKPASV